MPPGGAARLRGLLAGVPTRVRGGGERSWKGIGPESGRRTEAMLATLPRGWSPRGVAETMAARDLEPVHTGMGRLVGGTINPFRTARRDWVGYRDAACRAAGLSPARLGEIPSMLSLISDDIAARILLPLVDGAPEGWDSLADMRTAAARILWMRQDLLASLDEARSGDGVFRLRPRLARLDGPGWARAVRAEAGLMFGDPDAWWVPAPPDRLPGYRATA
jgi:hypothetical protein